MGKKLNYSRNELKIKDAYKNGEIVPRGPIESQASTINELKFEIISCPDCRKMFRLRELCAHHERLFLYDNERDYLSIKPGSKVLFARSQRVLEIQ